MNTNPTPQVYDLVFEVQVRLTVNDPNVIARLVSDQPLMDGWADLPESACTAVEDDAELIHVYEVERD